MCARYRHAGFEAILSHVDDRTSVNGLAATHATTTVVAAAYAFSSFHVVAGLLSFDDKRPDNQDGRGSWLGTAYRSGRHLVKAQWLRNQPRYGANNRTDAYGVGWQYEFSKRTALYSSVTRFGNQSDAGSAGLGRFNAAIPSGLAEQGNISLSELVLGMRMLF
jgi:predicted porin